MKKRYWIFSVFVLISTAGIIQLKSSPKLKSENPSSPLSSANKIFPELMGARKNHKITTVNPDELARIRENQQFKSYLQTAYVRLPTLETLRLSKNGDFHRVAPEVIETSEIFGDIADKLKSNPSLTREALKFYNACAGNEQLITSIRAVCARNLIDWANKSQIDISRASIPENILQLATVLPVRN